ncbi:MAG: 3-oxoacyl-ACP reductase, partial [Pusillimonas sp.]|nr:3-oxoacyl-ACP reductase [Pusillimonas sp.]
MDLGISGKSALVLGGSQGLGFACAQALAEAGVS